MVGKTTLDRYLTTPGEMEEIPEDERTTHSRILKIGKFKMPKPTRKRVSWQGEKRVVYSADIGGQERFWNLWIEDMVTRKCEAIVYMFDHRAFKGGDEGLQQIAGFRYLVDCLIERTIAIALFGRDLREESIIQKLSCWLQTRLTVFLMKPLQNFGTMVA